MNAYLLPNGNMLVPKRALSEDGKNLGDGLVEVEPGSPNHQAWAAHYQRLGKEPPAYEQGHKTKSLDEDKLRKFKEEADRRKKEDPEGSPDYGSLFHRPETGEVWYVTADGDPNDFIRWVVDELEGLAGEDKTTVEAEAFPPRDGWVEIKTLSAFDSTLGGALVPPPQQGTRKKKAVDSVENAVQYIRRLSDHELEEVCEFVFRGCEVMAPSRMEEDLVGALRRGEPTALRYFGLDRGPKLKPVRFKGTPYTAFKALPTRFKQQPLPHEQGDSEQKRQELVKQGRESLVHILAHTFTETELRSLLEEVQQGKKGQARAKHLGKGAGDPCEQGETATSTGCIPGGDESGIKKPQQGEESGRLERLRGVVRKVASPAGVVKFVDALLQKSRHPVRSAREARELAVRKLVALKDLYGWAGAAAMLGAYAGYYVVVGSINPVLLLVPVPVTGTIIASAEALRRLPLGRKDLPSLSPDQLVGLAWQYLQEICQELGEEVPPVDREAFALVVTHLYQTLGGSLGGDKSLGRYLKKERGMPCEQGEAAAITGCIPAKNDPAAPQAPAKPETPGQPQGEGQEQAPTAPQTLSVDEAISKITEIRAKPKKTARDVTEFMDTLLSLSVPDLHALKEKMGEKAPSINMALALKLEQTLHGPQEESDGGEQEQPAPEPVGGAGGEPGGAGPEEPGPEVAQAVGEPDVAGGDQGGEVPGEPAGAEAPRSIPATREEVNKRLERFERFFRAKGQHQVADWMGLVKSHVNAVGTEEALASLGEDVGPGDGEETYYEGAVSPEGTFFEAYLNRNGITPTYQLGEEGPAGTVRRISAQIKPETEEEGAFRPLPPALANKLKEAQALPGLEKSEDLSKLMGKNTHAFTPEVMAKLDETYGKGKWIVKSYGAEGYAGHGIYFPQRVEQMHRDAQNEIWYAGEQLGKYGFKLARDEQDNVTGLVHENGGTYPFDSDEYEQTIQGDARQWADRAAQAAVSEKGAVLRNRDGEVSGEEYMVQPAFAAVGVSDADRAAGKTIAPGEGRVHIVTQNGKATLVPHSTWIKGQGLPVVFEDEETKAMAKAAMDAINALPPEARERQIYAPDVIKTADGYKVVEANPSDPETGSSGYLEDNPFIIDAYVSHLTGRTPGHVKFLRKLLSQKKGKDAQGGGGPASPYGAVSGQEVRGTAKKQGLLRRLVSSSELGKVALKATGSTGAKETRKLLAERAQPAGKVKIQGMSEEMDAEGVDMDGLQIAWPKGHDGAATRAAQALADMHRHGELPKGLTRYTKRMVFSGQANKEDMHWSKTYNLPGFESDASAGGGEVCFYEGSREDYREGHLAGIIAHEMAHNLAEAEWGDDSSPSQGSDYAKAQQEEGPVTKYGASHPREDFAEAVKLYVTDKKGFAKKFPKKFAALDAMIKSHSEEGSRGNQSGGRGPDAGGRGPVGAAVSGREGEVGGGGGGRTGDHRRVRSGRRGASPDLRDYQQEGDDLTPRGTGGRKPKGTQGKSLPRFKGSPYVAFKDRGQPCQQGETAAQSQCIPKKPEGGGGHKPRFDKAPAITGKMAPAKRVGTGKDARVVLAGGKPAPAHIKPSMVPPDWTDVQISLDPQADLLVKARDKKGRIKSVYTDAFHLRNAALKFARVDEMIKKAAEIDKQIQAARTGPNAEEADCAWLMAVQATRPGSDSDTGAREKAYGATTLEGRHVVVVQGKVRLRFVGKEGVYHNHVVHDPALAKMLLERAKKAGRKGRLFATSEGRVNKFIGGLDGGHFSAKDFRTRRANLIASQLVQLFKGPPKDEKEYKARVKQVAEKVSGVLGNRPQQALESYINPAVFAVWRTT